MKLTKKKMVTIVAEAALEAAILADIKRLGVHGYTLLEAQGAGARGVRKGDWDQNRNIQIQAICSDDVAHAVMDHLFEQYYEDYAIIAYATEVEVHREHKF
jgi:nitrogen regulatory protein P-II 2